MKNVLVLACFSLLTTQVSAQTPPSVNSVKKSKILVHITEGIESPTKAALGFLVAKTALEEGHTVDIFLAGDAVKLLQDMVLYS